MSLNWADDPWLPERPVALRQPADQMLLSGYRGFQEIARSQSSVVYRAFQDGLDRPVAVKVLQVDDPEAAARFQREIEITVRLGRRHPNIVTVIETGTTAHGRPCIVMEYYDLGSLQDRLAHSGPLKTSEVLAIGAIVADALSFAHDQGVLHRDIKPQNILVLPTSYVVADFGISRAIGAAHTSSAEWFSFRHAAPQVLDGQAPSVADDIWSLGSTLFTLLDGRPPFATGDPAEDTALAYIRRVRTESPRSLDRRDMPVGVVAAIERCLQRQPEDRFPDAASVRTALEALSAQELAWAPGRSPMGTPADLSAVLAATPTPRTVNDDLATAMPPIREAVAEQPVVAPAARRWRRRLLAVSAGIIVGLAVAGGILTLRSRDEHVPPPPPARSAAVNDPRLAPVITKVELAGDNVTLQWRDQTAGEASFIVVRVLDNRGEAIRTVPAATTQAVLADLEPAAPPYCFQVIAVVGRTVGVSAQQCAPIG